MENAILFSTAGAHELLVAVPEHKDNLLGAYEWNFPETPGIKVSTVGTYAVPDHPTPLFDHLTVYRLELTAPEATQAFNMIRGAYPPFSALVQGKAQMVSHPITDAIRVHAALPARGSEELPFVLLVPVIDRSASTGYVWEQAARTTGLQVQSWVFPSEKSIPGAPATRVFAITGTEAGMHQVQFVLLPPGQVTPVASIAVSFDVSANAK